MFKWDDLGASLCSLEGSLGDNLKDRPWGSLDIAQRVAKWVPWGVAKGEVWL